MKADDIKNALAKAKGQGKKRNFSQRIDLIVNFKELDLKKPENQLDFFTALPNNAGKEKKIAGFVDQELLEEAKGNLEFYITADNFKQYASDKKKAKNVAGSYDYFVAQANIMRDVAGSFGRILGSRGKMPNPKAGMVIPPKGALGPIVSRLKKTVHVKVKSAPTFSAAVGSEKQTDDEITMNILSLYDQIVQHLPNEETNVKSVFIKTTMGAPVRLV